MLLFYFLQPDPSQVNFWYISADAWGGGNIYLAAFENDWP